MVKNRPRAALVRAFSFYETFGFQFGEVLFDGFWGDSDDFSEFTGRIVGVIFEQLKDFLPTFQIFLLLLRSFHTTFYELFNLSKVFQKVRVFTCVVY